MAGFTDTYENTVLDLAFANGDVIKLATDASGTDATNIAAFATNWNAASGGQKTGAGVTSGTATASKTYTHCAVFATGGSTQKTDWTALTAPVAVSAGGTFTFANGQPVVTLD